MPKNITPENLYPDFPVEVLINGDEADADYIADNNWQDAYNRIYHLKATTTSQADLIAGLDSEIEAINDTIITVQATQAVQSASIASIVTNTGGTTYSSNNFITDGASHEASLGVLDDTLNTTSEAIEATDAVVLANTTKINSVGGKLSVDAFDESPGLAFTDLTYLSSGMLVDTCLATLDPAIATNRRINNQNYITLVEFYMMQNSVASPNYFYDSLIDSSKTYSSKSTPGMYDNTRQSFGVGAEAWVYYTIAKLIEDTVDEIKVKINASSTGTITVYASLGNDYDGTFAEITDFDTWINLSGTVPTTPRYVIFKVAGTGGAKLYSIMGILK